ncbi:hypothetical protein ACGTN6_14965 [Halomonas sp. THAF12]|uniref:hypothetical protein n=1 Tax=Halomonas sp. B23F22_10 TaxID=3459515 RepID=UPI00373F9F6D
MTTTTKTKAPASAESWAQWLEEMDALQAERAEIVGLGEAREAQTRAENHARHVIRLANQTDALRFHHSPDETDHDTLHSLVRSIGSAAAKTQQADGWKIQPRERQQAIVELVRRASEATDQLEESRPRVAELEEARAEVEQRLEVLEGQAPKASASGLASLRKERDAALNERDRVARALDSMTADDSPLAMAREAERSAQERLEEAEALVAMGEASTEEAKAAQAEAKKAAQAHEKQQAEHRRQDAAHRGLARKLEEADNRLETLSRAHRQALGRVRHAELAALESELVADLERIAAERLDALARIHDDLEEAEPGHNYGPARIELKLPTLHHHPDADSLRHGLTITAHGREE